MSEDDFESELTGSREEIAAALSGVTDGILAGLVRLGEDADAVTVDVPEEVTLEVELEHEDGELSLELEVEWDAPEGDSGAAPVDEPPEAEETEIPGGEDVAVPVAAADASQSLARFEVFRDRASEWRWRLRHRNGNVIATAGQGYSSRGKAQKGLHSVRRNALGAGILRIETPVAEAEAIAVDDGPEPADAADPNVAVPSDDEAIASKATFELFEDAGGEWRWRLRHDNGNIISDSGEGYASKSNAKRALGRVREHVAAADYLRVDPTAFEVFRNAGGEWRWRLIHENGNVLADSGEGYSSRSKARQGLDSVQSNAAEAALEAVGDDGVAGDADGNPNATFELYEDAAEEYRWRLRHRNGNIIADSGEGYASRSNAVEGVTGVKANAPGAEAETVEAEE